MNKSRSTTNMPQQATEPDQQQTCRNNEQKRINNKHATHSATTKKHAATINRHAATNWLPTRMMYRHNSILRNRCRLFETKRSPIGWPTGVGLRTTTPRLTRLREWPIPQKQDLSDDIWPSRFHLEVRLRARPLGQIFRCGFCVRIIHIINS
jgi:hypothetical protein